MKRVAIVTTLVLASTWAGLAVGQPASPIDPSHPHSHATTGVGAKLPDLAREIQQLKSQVANLQAAVARTQPAGGSAPGGVEAAVQSPPVGMAPTNGMAAPQGMTGAAMGGMMSMGPGGAPPGGMGCCAMMGQMASGGGRPMSSLPGFPGASHLYHIGETGFFLDHPEHIALAPDQASKLGRIRETALESWADAERKLAAAEEGLWKLTAADQPSLEAIEAAVRQIEKLRADRRIAFIRAVGGAALVLTDDQRGSLLGQRPATAQAPSGMAPPTQQPSAAMRGSSMGNM
ncbi:MAG: hypothetical protein U0797_07715 [Gemmataceae bacterium]